MENMILAILQARVSSSRLPGKVLKPILGKAMLLHQIERIQYSNMIDKLVVATSTNVSDDAIEKICQNNKNYHSFNLYKYGCWWNSCFC